MRNRRKAWLGAAIGAAASLIGGGISAIMGDNASKEAQRQAQINQNKKDNYNLAQNLTAGYANQDYVDQMNERVSFSLGGRRRKAEEGGSFDWNSVINGVSSGLNSAMSGAVNAANLRRQNIKQGESLANAPKTEIKTPYYNTNVVNGYSDLFSQQQMLRCGGRKRR